MAKGHRGVLGAAIAIAAVSLGCLPIVAAEASAAPWSVKPVAKVIASWVNLDFDSFIERSYSEYLRRFPEWLTSLGLSGAFGVRNDALNDYSAGYVRETEALEQAVLERLRSYDRASLSAARQVTYDVFEWCFDDRVHGQEFALYDYPISHYTITSLHWAVFDLLTDTQPIASLEDAEDYVSRLLRVGRQFDQVIDGLRRRADAGIVVPKSVSDLALPEIDGLAGASAASTPFYTVFEEKLARIGGMSAGERRSLLSRAKSAIGEVVLPVYARIARALRELYPSAPYQVGVSQYPNGDAYYATLLRHYTGTEVTADEVHALGLQEVARLREEIRMACRDLGLPEDLAIPEVSLRAEEASGILYGSAVVQEYERLIDQASQRLAGVIEPLPSAKVIVVGIPVGGYYKAPATDGSRPGAFYASLQGPQPRYSMPTLAYHETIPGHHVQIAGAMDLALPMFRQVESFLGYTEGWALYAERLAWELGWYAEDPYGNLGRLKDEMMRAVRLVVDTGIHTRGWTAEDAIAYFVENTGKARATAEREVFRYIVWPGQATAYMVGMLHLLDLRRTAKEALGDRFRLIEFHDAVLGGGNAPLAILDRLVGDYIDRASGR